MKNLLQRPVLWLSVLACLTLAVACHNSAKYHSKAPTTRNNEVGEVAIQSNNNRRSARTQQGPATTAPSSTATPAPPKALSGKTAGVSVTSEERARSAQRDLEADQRALAAKIREAAPKARDRERLLTSKDFSKIYCETRRSLLISKRK